MAAGSRRDLVLSARPHKTGSYKIDAARWSLSEYFSVVTPLRRDGPLLQRTLQQRSSKERMQDESLRFEVVPAHPLLRLSFEGLSPEV